MSGRSQSIPDNILHHRWRYRLGYISSQLIMFILIFLIPDTCIHRARSLEYDYDVIAILCLNVVCTMSAYFFLQGSDPGYLSLELLEHLELGSEAINSECKDDSEAAAQLLKVQIHKKRIRDLQEELEAMERLKEANETKTNDEQEETQDLLASSDPELKLTMPLCEHCCIRPPLRSHHCRYCSRCVATYDHHCFCVGTCIGEKNHCRFWWFLLFQSFQVIWGLVVVSSGFHFEKSFSLWIRGNSLALAAAVILWTMAFVAIPLLIFHSFLLSGNLTTYEIGKGPEKLSYLTGTKECDLPFSKGIVENINGFCCIRDGVWGVFGRRWRPTIWTPPREIIRDSENVFDNLWENKYYSCC